MAGLYQDKNLRTVRVTVMEMEAMVTETVMEETATAVTVMEEAAMAMAVETVEAAVTAGN
tara:strand:- start:944 stop:1123 length:180 start_codon:yes stop_codon:yes gene_type:complete